MAISHKLSGLKRTKWENKSDKEKIRKLKNHYEELGYKIPNYLQGNKINDKDFNRALNKVTVGYEKKVTTQKKVKLDYRKLNVKQLNSELGKTIKQLNKTIDVTLNNLRKQGYNDIQLEYLQGNPLYSTLRKKPYYKDNITLEKEDMEDLFHASKKDILNSIKRIKDKTKFLKSKKFEKELNNSTEYDNFFNEFLNEFYMNEMEDIDKDYLHKIWNSLSAIQKEIVTKTELNELRERYKNSSEVEISDKTATNIFNRVINSINSVKDFI